MFACLCASCCWDPGYQNTRGAILALLPTGGDGLVGRRDSAVVTGAGSEVEGLCPGLAVAGLCGIGQVGFLGLKFCILKWDSLQYLHPLNELK